MRIEIFDGGGRVDVDIDGHHFNIDATERENYSFGVKRVLLDIPDLDAVEAVYKPVVGDQFTDSDGNVYILSTAGPVDLETGSVKTLSLLSALEKL